MVWIRLMERPSTVTSRLMAEMMPLVMVPRSSEPRGSPMATTESPTRRLSESPNWAGVRSDASMASTARSEASSLPTSRAANLRSSESRTEIVSAPSTTWALVTRYPSWDNITPVPLAESVVMEITEGAQRT